MTDTSGETIDDPANSRVARNGRIRTTYCGGIRIRLAKLGQSCNQIACGVEWSDFYVTNAIVIALGIAQAQLAPVLPLAPLTFASLMLINAVFFHILPFVRMRGRFSPGLATAILLFLPAGIAVWRKAGREVSLDWTTVVLAVAGGAALMAYPIIMLNLRDRPYFRQS